MEFKTYYPAPHLQPFVECYLEAESITVREKGEHVLFPNGLSGIFFNFGNMGKLIINEEVTTPLVSIFGQIDQHFKVAYPAGFLSIGILMKPSILSHLLHLDMAEFTNRAFDGQLIRGDLLPLHERMEELSSISSKLALVEKYLTNALAKLSHTDHLVDNALHLIHHQRIISIDQLSTNLRVSQRHLEIRFRQTVGLTPKTYYLIDRFKRMEQQVRKLKTIHWPDMSFASEYYDQNHFIKDFKRFTGMTPSEYLIENVAMGRSYLTSR